MNTIVVGIDGSTQSKDALRFALTEALTHGAQIVAVHAWHLPPFALGAALGAPISAPDADALRKDAEETLENAILEVAGEKPEVEITPCVQEGTAAAVLVEAAKDADLLVVGSRGHGGFVGLLLGSVSQQCAHHAPCPVVIFRNAASASR